MNRSLQKSSGELRSSTELTLPNNDGHDVEVKKLLGTSIESKTGSGSPQTPLPASESKPLPGREALRAMQRIPNYQLSKGDVQFVADLLEDFPTLNIADEIKDAAAWLQDRPRRTGIGSRPRVFLRNWMRRAAQDYVTARFSGSTTNPLKLPSVDEQLAALKARA